MWKVRLESLTYYPSWGMHAARSGKTGNVNA